MTKKSKVIPPDFSTCQAEKPNGHSFMTLGGSLGRLERCSAKPSIIIIENAIGNDGLHGCMSLCDDCFKIFKKQSPKADVTVWERKS